MTHLDKHECFCSLSQNSTSQTIDELDFERGIWTAALYGEINDIHKHIAKGNINAKDNSGYTGEFFKVH